LDAGKYVETPNDQTYDPANPGKRIYNHGIVGYYYHRYGIAVGSPPTVRDYFSFSISNDYDFIPTMDFLVSTQNLNTPEINSLGYGLGKAYPNPTNGADQFIVPFVLGQGGNVSFTLSDITGKVVRSIHGNFQSGENEVTIGTEGLNSGIYIFSMTAGSYKGTGKVIVR
jgi:hypothetical protein